MTHGGNGSLCGCDAAQRGSRPRRTLPTANWIKDRRAEFGDESPLTASAARRLVGLYRDEGRVGEANAWLAKIPEQYRSGGTLRVVIPYEDKVTFSRLKNDGYVPMSFQMQPDRLQVTLEFGWKRDSGIVNWELRTSLTPDAFRAKNRTKAHTLVQEQRFERQGKPSVAALSA